MGRKQSKGEYQVRDILNFKEEEGQEYVLIWWAGYPKREATWEPIQNISNIYDFNQYYRRLNQDYEQSQQLSNSLRSNQQQHPQPSEEIPSKSVQAPPSKLKKISKKSKKSKYHSDAHHSGQEKISHAKSKQEQPVIQFKPSKSAEKNRIENSNPNIQNNLGPNLDRQQIKRMIKQAPPVKFQIKIKEFKELPLSGQKLKSIKQAFQRDGKTMYEVELESQGQKDPIILHENYIRALWPRELAEFLLSKVK